MLRRLGIGLVLLAAVLAVAFLALRDPSLPRAYVVEKYSSEASQFIEIAGGAIAHIRDEGNRNGYPLVLIHGSNASLHTWEPWVAELGDTFRIISMDMPAHGLTGAVPGTPYDAYDKASQIAFVDAVVSEMGVSKFAMAGNSMGGHITWRYALEHPEKLSHLILLDASGIPPPGGFETPYVFRLLGMPVIGPLLGQITPRRLFEDGLRASFTDQSLVTDEMIDRYRELALMEGSREANIIRYGHYNEDVLHLRLAEISLPTLILWGEDDALVPVASGWEFAKRMPNSTLTIYEGVGHIPMEEVAKQSAADVREFLGGL